MTLRTKTLLAVGATLLGLAAVLTATSSRILLRGYAELEEKDALQNLARAREALADELSNLDATVGDYAGWDDTYRFAEDRNPAYAATNLNDTTFAKLRLDLALVIDAEGRLAYAKAFDSARQVETSLAPGTRDALLRRRALWRHARTDASVSGVILLPEGPMLLASRPILTSEYKGPIRGAFVMGRLLGAAELARLSKSIRLGLTAWRLDDPLLPPAFRPASRVLADGREAGVWREDDRRLAGFTQVMDIDGRPVALLRVSMPRVLYRQGLATVTHLTVSLLAVALVFGAVMVVLLERLVLARIARLGAQVAAIGSRGDLSARVSAEGNDELSALGRTINQAFDDLSCTQRDLQESERRYRAVVEQATDGIALVDASSARFIDGNDAFLRLLGGAPAGLSALTLHEMLDLDPRELERGLVDARRAGWRVGGQKVRRAGGPHGDAELTVSPVTLGGRSVLCAVMRDISERKRAEEELRLVHDDLERRVEERTLELTEAYSCLQWEVAQREQMQADLNQREEQLRQAQKMEAIGRLAGGVAHDFNNLLTAITSYADLLVRHLDGQDRLRGYAQGIEATAERAAGLTRQLLAFSRSQVLQPVALDLNHVFTEVDRMLRRLIGEDVELVCALEPDLWTVQADQNQLEQVLMNLVVNARDAMPQGGRLTIETANVAIDERSTGHRADISLGRYVALCVTDTGTGMDAETLARAFDPFFTTKPAGQGTGLGLATVYGIVKQSGGHVWACSEPAKGTAITIYLPRADGDAAGIGSCPVPAPAARARPEGETVLLVEDDDGVRLPLREGLVAKGYSVVEAGDGERALEAAACLEGRLDLLVTDVVMPRLGGRELAERLSAARPGLRVVFMSGYTDDAVVRSGILAANVAYLQKPFSVEVLARKVRQVLDEPRASGPAGSA